MLQNNQSKSKSADEGIETIQELIEDKSQLGSLILAYVTGTVDAWSKN